MRINQRMKTYLAVVGLLVLATTWGQAQLTYTTGLDVWLDAADMNGNGDGNIGWSDNNTLAVSTKDWVNKGSAGNPTEYGLGAAGAPVYRTSITVPLGGTAPAVQFGNDNVRLPEFMNSDTFSIFAVVQRTANGNGADPLFWDYGTTGSKFANLTLDEGNGNTGAVNGAVRDSGNDVLSAAGTSNIGTSVSIVEMVLSESAGTYALEAGPFGATATDTDASYGSTTWEGTFSPPVIGSFPSGDVLAHTFAGNLFEILIYDHAVTGANRTAVENYLSGKYIQAAASSTPGTLIYGK